MKTYINRFILICLGFTVIFLSGMSSCDTEEELATFIQAVPATGSTIQADEDIIVVFDMPPAGLSVEGGEFSLSDTSVTITGPFTSGTLNIMLTWTEGTQALTYTVEPIEKPITGLNIVDLVTGLQFPTAIALDVADRKMYWTDKKMSVIQRANLDGSNVETLLAGVTFSLNTDITLDVASGKMYWIQFINNREWGGIRRANLDGTNVENLVTGLDTIESIALDVASGNMYWTEQGDFYADDLATLRAKGKIRRSD